MKYSMIAEGHLADGWFLFTFQPKISSSAIRLLLFILGGKNSAFLQNSQTFPLFSRSITKVKKRAAWGYTKR